MSKILNAQLTGIFNRLENQALDIQMAAQCIIQAIGSEGKVYIKGYGDLKFYESFVLNSDEKLYSSFLLDNLISYNVIDTTDRELLFSPFYTTEVAKDVQQLINLDVDFVLICNKPKQDDFPEHLMHYVNLSTPRPIVYTEDYDKIVQPHPMTFNYIYYAIYTQMVEMTRDLDL